MNPKLDLDADTLACALALTGKGTPTPAALATALAELYPNGGGPTVPDLLAAGWLVPTVDGRGLRVPPLSLAEQDARLVEAVPELVLKLHTSSPAPLIEQDTRLAGYESKNALVSERVSKLNTPSLHSSKVSFVGCPSDWTPSPASPLLSYYRGPITNTVPYAAINYGQLHRVLVQPPPYLRERADAARAEYAAHGKSSTYRALKNGLDYFTAGGTFAPTRADAHLAAASGYLTLDFDELNGRVAEARAALLTDPALAPALVLVFVSPSGDGLKAVLRADPRHTRKYNYEALTRHLTRRYGWGPTLDARTADVSRACFLSHDPDAWLAPAYAAHPPATGRQTHDQLPRIPPN